MGDLSAPGRIASPSSTQGEHPVTTEQTKPEELQKLPKECRDQIFAHLTTIDLW